MTETMRNVTRTLDNGLVIETKAYTIKNRGRNRIRIKETQYSYTVSYNGIRITALDGETADLDHRCNDLASLTPDEIYEFAKHEIAQRHAIAYANSFFSNVVPVFARPVDPKTSIVVAYRPPSWRHRYHVFRVAVYRIGRNGGGPAIERVFKHEDYDVARRLAFEAADAIENEL